MKHYCNISGGCSGGRLWDFGLFWGEDRLLSSKCDFILTLFCAEKLKDVLRLAGCCLFWQKKIIHCHVQLYSPLFGIEKTGKRFSPLKRRSESAATWRISPSEAKYASEIPKTLILHCPHSCVAKSPRDRRADGFGF